MIGTDEDSIVFDWQPDIQAGDVPLGPRGTDSRLADW
jgi:GTP-binding protein